MIEDYLREREDNLRELEAAVTERSAEILPDVTPPRADRRSRFGLLLVVTVILAAAALGGWWLLSGRGIAQPTQATVASQAAATDDTTTPASPEAGSAETPIAVATIPSERSVQPRTPSVPAPAPAPTQAVASTLSIPEHGVGTGIENRQLVGRRDRFTEGTEVWFLTHVQGGSSGDTIHHVWLHQGVEKWRKALSVGGPRWRTYSAKTLHPGSVGDWAVEVRDNAGQVLARRDFLCVH